MQPGEIGFGLLFASIRDAVIVADASSGRILLWNPAAETLFGYSAAEAAELRVDDLVPLHLKARHLTGISRYNASGHGTLIDSGQPIELPALTKRGGHDHRRADADRGARAAGRHASARQLGDRHRSRRECARACYG